MCAVYYVCVIEQEWQRCHTNSPDLPTPPFLLTYPGLASLSLSLSLSDPLSSENSTFFLRSRDEYSFHHLRSSPIPMPPHTHPHTSSSSSSSSLAFLSSARAYLAVSIAGAAAAGNATTPTHRERESDTRRERECVCGRVVIVV